MSYSQVAQALANGADPDMLCMTCPWDRFCIQPPTMTKSEVDAKIAEAQQEDERRAKAAGGKPGPPMNTLLTAVTIGGMHTTAAICPVLAMRLRLAEGQDAHAVPQERLNCHRDEIPGRREPHVRLLRRRGKRPDPPQEVRLILPDGSRVGPLPLRYEGVTDGLHRWVALADRRLIPADGQPLSFRIKMMPAKTSVLVAFVPSKELETYL